MTLAGTYLDDFKALLLEKRGRQDGSGSVGPHTAGVGPLVVVEHALVVLRSGINELGEGAQRWIEEAEEWMEGSKISENKSEQKRSHEPSSKLPAQAA